MKNKLLSALLTIVIAACPVVASGTTALATDAGNLTATKGVYWFETHEVGHDLTDTFIYDDDLLKGDSLNYNQKLATMSFELAVASESSERFPKTTEGYKLKSLNLRSYLTDNGFVDFDTNQDYKEKMTRESMGAACAHKKIVDNGKEYTLLAIVPRSAGYESEWGSNFKMSGSPDDIGDHAGFKNGRNKVLEFAGQYVEKYGIKGDIKVWTAGYSRGAGVTNQVGAALLAQPNQYLGSNVHLDPSNVYCYTFGTPKSASTGTNGADFGQYDASLFKRVHNTFETYDIITIAPPAGFGFNRYGSDSDWSHNTYASAANKERMLWFLKQTNNVVYDLYMNGGDPDGFKPKTIDPKALIKEQKLVIKDDPNPDAYLPKNQRDFMRMMDESVNVAVDKDKAATGTTTREKYCTGGYQDAAYYFCGWYFSHLEKGDALIQGIEGSRFAIPLVASMYISYMLERFPETQFSDLQGSKGAIELSISKLEAIIADMKTKGEAIPAGLEADIASFKSELNSATTFGDVSNRAGNIRTILFGSVFGSGLKNAGMDSDDPTAYNNLTGTAESRALSRILTYVMLYDVNQTEKKISFTEITQQVSHFATFMGNASSYMRPHNNEIILSWLRTLDSNYDDFVKENAAQQSGYRRAYISQPAGVDVTGQVKDENGNVLAEFKNGAMTSRSDNWIGITTSDNGNWLRLPADKKYFIDLDVSKETTLDLRMAEWSINDDKEVRIETSDKKYNWTGLKMKPGKKVRWVFEAVPAGSDGSYKLPSTAAYYIQYLATITFDLNGGKLWKQSGKVTKEYAIGDTIKMPKPTRKGYTFKYWKGSKYKAGAKYKIKGDHTFKAVWGKGSGVDTGDHNDLTTWMLVMAVSLMTILLMAVLRLRRRHI